MRLGIAVTGFVPSINDPDAILTVMLTAIAAGLGFLLLAFVSGFARDIEREAGIAMECISRHD